MLVWFETKSQDHCILVRDEDEKSQRRGREKPKTRRKEIINHHKITVYAKEHHAGNHHCRVGSFIM